MYFDLHGTLVFHHKGSYGVGTTWRVDANAELNACALATTRSRSRTRRLPVG